MYIQLTYQIHLGDSPFFVYLGVNVLANPIMSERSWIHTHEVLSSTHKKKKKLNKRRVLEIQFEMESHRYCIITLLTPQGHYIVTNQSLWLEGVIELIVRNMEAIDLNERWPCRKEKAI